MTEFKWPENCLDCDYHYADLAGHLPYCQLFHGNGISPNCEHKKSRLSKELRRSE